MLPAFVAVERATVSVYPGVFKPFSFSEHFPPPMCLIVQLRLVKTALGEGLLPLLLPRAVTLS